jgi:hypothetical protein
MMAEALKEDGIDSSFAITSRYYEAFKGVSLSDIGSVRYLSDFLRGNVSPSLDGISLDYWMIYPTYVRYRYFHGSHNNSWDKYKQTVLFYRHLFNENEDIALVCSEPPSNAFLYLGYAEAQERGVPYFGYAPARIPRHFNVFLDAYENMLENKLAAPSSLPSSGPPDYMRNPTNQLYAYSFAKEIPSLITRFLRAIQTRSEDSLEAGSTLLYQIKAYQRMFFRKWRYRISKHLYGVFEQTIDFDKEQIAVIYPLQYRPEASTSVSARYYGNDKEVIRNIAFSLPDQASLFVKEHPAAIGIRGTKFYQDILSYPGVHLIDIDFPLQDNLHRFNAVITLTSTVGFEALQAKVPVYLLGAPFYQDYPGVIKIDSFNDLNDHLKSLGKNTAEGCKDDVLERYRRFCFEGNFNYMTPEILLDENISKLISPILWQVEQSQHC